MYLIKGMQEQQGEIVSLRNAVGNLTLTDSGEVQITQTQTGEYQVTETNGSIIDRVGAFTTAMAAKIKAGSISASEIAVDNLTVAGKSLQQYIDDRINAVLSSNSINSLIIGGKTINQLIDERIESVLLSINYSTGSNTIVSPIVETTDIIATGTATLNTIETNEIKPQNQDVVINLENTDPNAGKLAKLIIKGLEGKTVTTIDSAGNASFSGQVIADSLTINNDATVAGNLTAESSIINHLTSNDASISGKLIAGEIESSTINDIQALLADIKNQPVPNLTNETNLSNVSNLESLTVSGNSNLYNVSVSNSLLVGTTLFDQNSIISLASELRLSALSTINLFDGAVVIAKDGKITTSGEIIAQGGIRTDEIKPLTDDGQVNINQLATNQLVISDKYLSATNSASIIAAADNFEENGIFAPAIETATASAGIAILPESSNEVVIYNNYVKDNSLIYLTPTSANGSVSSLSVGQKEDCSQQLNSGAIEQCKKYFKVTGQPSSSPVKFNWLIVN